MLENLFTPTTTLPKNVRRLEIPSGHLGTTKTIEHMSRMALTGARDPRIRAKAISIIKGNEGVPAAKDRDFRQYADRLFRFVQKLYYIHDPVDVELLEDPYKLLELGGGDCDSVSLLLASLALAAGMRADFVTIKADPGSDEWSHVYTRIHLPDGTIVPCDCTMKKKPSGWEPKGYTKKIWPISSAGGDPNGSDQTAPHDITDKGNDLFPSDNDVRSDDDLFSGESGGILMRGLSAPRRRFVNRPLVKYTSLVTPRPVRRPMQRPHTNFVKSMAGLGADPLTENTLVGVLDGSIANELEAKRTKMNEQTGKLFDLQTAAEKISDPVARSRALQIANNANASLLIYKRQIYDAINKYNTLSQDIQTRSAGLLKPRQLGFLPAAAIPILQIAAIAAALYALSSVIGAIRGTANATEGYISQLARAIEAGGGAVEKTGDASLKFGIVAAVGVALFFGITYMKKKGKM